MSSTYTSSLAIQLMGTGDQSGTWGATTNNNMTYLEEGISGYLSYAVGPANAVTLNLTQGGDTSPSARNMIINLTNGGATAGVTMTVPGTASKLYFIWNQTGQAVTVQGTTPTATVTIPNAAQTVVFCDGANNVYLALGALYNVNITGGSINSTTIGATTPSTGAFTTLSATGAFTGASGSFTSGSFTSGCSFTTISASGQITSTVATGTAPFVIASTTNVPNLNASSLNGTTFASPGTIGGTTPAAGNFTSVTTTGDNFMRGVGLVKRKTSTLAITSNVVFTTDSQLTFSAVAVGTYSYKAIISTSGSATNGGLQVNFSSTGGTSGSGVYYTGRVNGAAVAGLICVTAAGTGTAITGLTTVSTTGTGSADIILLEGILTVTAQLTTLIVQFRQDTSSANSTNVNTGTYVMLTQLS